jgi:hypothetical protein
MLRTKSVFTLAITSSDTSGRDSAQLTLNCLPWRWSNRWGNHRRKEAHTNDRKKKKKYPNHLLLEELARAVSVVVVVKGNEAKAFEE